MKKSGASRGTVALIAETCCLISSGKVGPPHLKTFTAVSRSAVPPEIRPAPIVTTSKTVITLGYQRDHISIRPRRVILCLSPREISHGLHGQNTPLKRK